jgi:hypothetical protein
MWNLLYKRVELMKKYDLHMHSNLSDGELHWKDVITLCKKRGLSGISMTEHNLAGPLDEIKMECEKNSLEFIPAVEIKANCSKSIERYKRGQANFNESLLKTQELILYGLNPNAEFLEMSKAHVSGKVEYVKELCRRLQLYPVSAISGLKGQAKIEIDVDRILLDAGSYVGSTHVMAYLIAAYRGQASCKNFGKQNVKKIVVEVQGDLGYILESDPFYSLDLLDAVALGKKWGCVTVLAHPLSHGRKEMHKFYDEILFPELKEAGLDGVELDYPEHSLEDREFLRGQARTYGWLVTGGSDFHRLSDEEYLPGTCFIENGDYLKLVQKINSVQGF